MKPFFSEENYPKSYASTDKSDYRLDDYLNKPRPQKAIAETFLFLFVYNKATSNLPLNRYKGYKFIGASWEWSSFLKDKKTVVKVPAQIFKEVNDKRYIDNTKKTYEKIRKYFPNKYVAQSEFYRENGRNIIRQEYIKGKDDFYVPLEEENKELLDNLSEFLNHSLDFLKKEKWLPDFDIKRNLKGFNIRNIVFEEDAYIPKIIDFTAYYDVYRLYPERTKREVEGKRKQIKEFLKWLEEKSKH